MADPKWFAGRLRELREGAGLGRKDLAERAGLRSEGGIRDIEQGLSLPRWDMVLTLCQAIGCTPLDFMKEPEPSPTTPKRGRPPKPVADDARPATNRPRGRPRKDAEAEVQPAVEKAKRKK